VTVTTTAPPHDNFNLLFGQIRQLFFFLVNGALVLALPCQLLVQLERAKATHYLFAGTLPKTSFPYKVTLRAPRVVVSIMSYLRRSFLTALLTWPGRCPPVWVVEIAELSAWPHPSLKSQRSTS